MATKKSIFDIKNTTYDRLKIVATTILPAISALYLTIAGIWGLPFGEQVAATIGAIIALINTLAGLFVINSSTRYSQAHQAKKPAKKTKKA